MAKKKEIDAFYVMNAFVQALPKIKTVAELDAMLGWMEAKGRADLDARNQQPGQAQVA